MWDCKWSCLFLASRIVECVGRILVDSSGERHLLRTDTPLSSKAERHYTPLSPNIMWNEAFLTFDTAAVLRRARRGGTEARFGGITWTNRVNEETSLNLVPSLPHECELHSLCSFYITGYQDVCWNCSHQWISHEKSVERVQGMVHS